MGRGIGTNGPIQTAGAVFCVAALMGGIMLGFGIKGLLIQWSGQTNCDVIDVDIVTTESCRRDDDGRTDCTDDTDTTITVDLTLETGQVVRAVRTFEQKLTEYAEGNSYPCWYDLNNPTTNFKFKEGTEAGYIVLVVFGSIGICVMMCACVAGMFFLMQEYCGGGGGSAYSNPMYMASSPSYY